MRRFSQSRSKTLLRKYLRIKREFKQKKKIELVKGVWTLLVVFSGAVIAGIFSCHIAENIQGKAEERSDVIQQKHNDRITDIEIMRMIIDIEDRGNPVLYKYYPLLVLKLTDQELVSIAQVAIKANVDVPESIKAEVDSSARHVSNPKTVVSCAIIYLKDDVEAREEAQDIKDFMSTQIQTDFVEFPFEEFKVETRDSSWYKSHYPNWKKEGVDYVTLFVFYNNISDTDDAQRLYFAMKEGIFGIIYEETLNRGFIGDESNRGSGYLRDLSFSDVNKVLKDGNMRLQEFDFAIVIPPRKQ